MALHLIKLCVGCGTLSQLAQWQAERLQELKIAGQTPELMHITRHMPRRTEELLNGGSLYWVIDGWVSARQKLTGFRPVERDGIVYCGLVYDPVLVRVQPRPHRPFQGWRYLAENDAPADIAAEEDAWPDDMRRELVALGLL